MTGLLGRLRGAEHRQVLSNVSSLVGTSAVTAVLGFGYWWLAARLFSPEAVGLASAAISAMLLLGTVGMWGLGTLLISELPRRGRSQVGTHLSTALLIAGAVSALLGVLYMLGVANSGTDLSLFARGPLSVVLFAFGVALTGAVLVFDQAVIGLLRGEVQLRRNALFALSKLVALLPLAFLWRDPYGVGIYTTWLLGNAVSLAALGARAALPLSRPSWQLARSWWNAALKHHWLNLASQAPGLVLPILVTVLLSAAINARFYVAWMLISFVYMLPYHFSTVLHAVGSGAPLELARKARFSFRTACMSSGVLSVGLFLFAPWLLGLFGAHYAEATLPLRLLILGTLPVVFKMHYIAICRVEGRLARAAWVMSVGGGLELGLAALGAQLGGLTGLSIGYVAALYLEAIVVSPTVWRVLRKGV